MTAKEALDKLDKTVTGDLEWKIALTEALEKQIAKKPLTDKLRKEGYCGCPMCKHLVDSVSNYCEHCGQKLDWSEEE